MSKDTAFHQLPIRSAVASGTPIQLEDEMQEDQRELPISHENKLDHGIISTLPLLITSHSSAFLPGLPTCLCSPLCLQRTNLPVTTVVLTHPRSSWWALLSPLTKGKACGIIFSLLWGRGEHNRWGLRKEETGFSSPGDPGAATGKQEKNTAK